MWNIVCDTLLLEDQIKKELQICLPSDIKWRRQMVEAPQLVSGKHWLKTRQRWNSPY